MSTHKNIDRICVAVILVAMVITVLFMNGAALGLQVIVDDDAERNSGSKYFTVNDRDGSWDTTDATIIELQGSDAIIHGKGAYSYEGSVVISESGRYVLSGELVEGSILVDTHKTSKVWLLLNGVSVHCSSDACIRINKADKVFLTLAENSENALISGESFSKEAVQAGTNGAIFAKDDLSINGSGALSVVSGYYHGISSKDKLVIAGGKISVRAPQDAIHVSERLAIADAELTLSAGDDGIAVKGTDEKDRFFLESGKLSISAGDDGITAACAVSINDGSIVIQAGDDAIHSDESIDIHNGSIIAESCYEGMEAPKITQYSGNIVLYPKDDGLNASSPTMAGSFDLSHGRPFAADRETIAAQEQTEMQPDAEQAELPCVSILGGSLTIINEAAQDADGIDSNGDILISGGEIRISLVGTGTNNALDFGTESGGICKISGGRVIAAGSAAMAEGISEKSEQASIMYRFPAGVPADTSVCLKDTNGNVLLDWDVPCSFSSLILSCPEMLLGETYSVEIGDEESEVTLDRISSVAGSSVVSSPGNIYGGGMPRGENGFPGHGGAGPADQMHRPEMENGFGEYAEMPMPPMDNPFVPYQSENKGEKTSLPKSALSGMELESESGILVVCSAAVLAGAVLFAARFRKRK